MGIMTIGIDPAKNIFAVHGVDENGKADLIKPKVSRDQLLPGRGVDRTRTGAIQRRRQDSAGANYQGR